MIEPIPIALAFAAVFGGFWRIAGRRSFGVLACAWVGYAVYEFLMFKRVLCTGECNIRVDLLLYPALLGSSAWVALAAAARAVRARRGDN